MKEEILKKNKLKFRKGKAQKAKEKYSAESLFDRLDQTEDKNRP
jgi:hypothetical protein